MVLAIFATRNSWPPGWIETSAHVLKTREKEEVSEGMGGYRGEVAILVGLEACLSKDSVVVAPGGVRHVYVHTGVVLGEELGGNAEGTSAGERLADSNLLVLDDGRILAEDHLPSIIHECLNSSSSLLHPTCTRFFPPECHL